MLPLHLTERCYEAKICIIILPLRYLYAKTMAILIYIIIIVRGFDHVSFHTCNSSLEGATDMKFDDKGANTSSDTPKTL